jgi:hypothetical protein
MSQQADSRNSSTAQTNAVMNTGTFSACESAQLFKTYFTTEFFWACDTQTEAKRCLGNNIGK